MSFEMAADLVVCGVLAAGACFLADHFHASLRRASFLTGVLGGALCVVLGVLGHRGMRSRWSAITTLTAMACVFLFQAVESWDTLRDAESKGPPLPLLMAVLTVFCLGTVANLARDGREPQL